MKRRAKWALAHSPLDQGRRFDAQNLLRPRYFGRGAVRQQHVFAHLDFGFVFHDAVFGNPQAGQCRANPENGLKDKVEQMFRELYIVPEAMEADKPIPLSGGDGG